MKWMQLLVLRVLMYTVQCGWELFKSELMDSSTFTLWKKQGVSSGTSLLQVCGVQPDLSSKLLQGDTLLTRSIPMPTIRAFSKIRISFDLYYLNLWSSAESISVYANSLLVFNEIPQLQTSIDFPMRFCTTRPFGKSYEEKLIRIDEEIQFNDANLELQIVHQNGGSTTSQYGIRSFVLQVYFCDDLCEECDEFQCLTCKLGYDLVNYQCRCDPMISFSFFNPILSCVTQCPSNYIADNNKICQPGTVTQEFFDLDQLTFTSYKFEYQPDKYYSNNIPMIQTIDSKSVAGMFGNTDTVIYNNLNLISGQTYQAKITIYITGQMQKIIPDQIVIKFNGYVGFKLSDFQFLTAISILKGGKGYVISQTQCIAIGFTQCKQYQIELQFTLSEDVNQIEFATTFNLNISTRKWAFRDFIINSYSITGTQINCLNNCGTCNPSTIDVCLSCTGSFYLFNGQCILICPDYTNAISNVCVDSAVSTQQQKYEWFYDLNYQAFNQQNNWVKRSYFMNHIMIGGYNQWSNQQIIHKLTNLPIFYQVTLKFQLIFIDSTNSQIFLRTSINNEQPQYNLFGSGISVLNQVGQYYNEVEQSVTYNAKFTSTTELTVQLQCIQGIDTSAYCGIYNYRIIITKCPQFCSQCDEYGVCITGIDNISTNISGCKIGYYLIDGKCESCGQYCQMCGSVQQCTQCNNGYELKHGTCYCQLVKDSIDYCDQSNCFHNCKTCLNENRNVQIRNRHPGNCLSCDESKHLWLNVNQCTCLDGYYMENFQCYVCYPTCKKCTTRARQCSECIAGQNRILKAQQCDCQDGYFQAENDLVCAKCNDLCEKCSLTNTTCKSCYISQNRQLYNDTCICINGFYDNGTLQCQQCSQSCATCSDINTCLTCNIDQNRQLSIDNKSCVCKSGYYQQSNTFICGQCSYSCQECNSFDIQNCTRCPQTREPSSSGTQFSCKCKIGYYDIGNLECLDCADYLNPPSSHYCYSFCGDNKQQWNEQCDDGNNNNRDGCYKCLLSDSYCLNPICTGCRAGICTGCIDGYFLTSDSICSQCDQSCKTCVDRSNNCTDCTILKSDGSGCLVCESDVGYQIIDNQCVNICGDGIKISPELCDDGNISNGDGCDFNCQIEIGWKCETLCEQLVYPSLIFELNNEKQYENERIVRIKTDSIVQINGDINSIFAFKINNSNNYQVSYIDLTSYSNDYNQMLLELTITFQIPVSVPELICTILSQDSIINKQGNSFQQKSFMTQLTPYQPANNATSQATDGLMKLSKYILYLLFGFAILAFLFGGLDIFWNLLDTLQLISYLQFLNVIFPYNVNNYFTIFGFAQFDFIKQFFNMEEFISQYVNTPDAAPKFSDQGYSTVFYVNIIAVATVFMTTLLTFIGCKLLFQTLTKIAHSFIYAPIEDHSEQSVCTFFIYRVTRNLQISLLKITQEFMSGIIRTFMAVAFDYNLAIFLQLQDISIQDPILLTSFIFCLFALISELYFLYQASVFMSKPSYIFKMKLIENNFGAIYEGIKLEKNPFTYYYNIVLLAKKMLFMMFLVMFYSSPCIQIGLVSLLNIVMALYIIKVKPLEGEDEQFKQIGSELFIWLAELLILVLAINQSTNQLSEDGQLNVGWCIICVTTLLILFQLYLDIKQHINFLMNEYIVIKKLIDRFKLLLNGKEPEQEQNIFLKGRRRLGIENLTSQNNILTTKNNRSFASLKQGKVVTFTLSSSSS